MVWFMERLGILQYDTRMSYILRFFVAKLTFCSSLPLLNSLWWTLFHLFHTVYGTGRVSVIGDCKQTPNSFHKIQIST